MLSSSSFLVRESKHEPNALIIGVAKPLAAIHSGVDLARSD